MRGVVDDVVVGRNRFATSDAEDVNWRRARGTEEKEDDRFACLDRLRIAAALGMGIAFLFQSGKKGFFRDMGGEE